jgi:hypothetical protein
LKNPGFFSCTGGDDDMIGMVRADRGRTSLSVVMLIGEVVVDEVEVEEAEVAGRFLQLIRGTWRMDRGFDQAEWECERVAAPWSEVMRKRSPSSSAAVVVLRW